MLLSKNDDFENIYNFCNEFAEMFKNSDFAGYVNMAI